MSSIAALHWPVWDHYLISALAPAVDLVLSVPGETADKAIARFLRQRRAPDLVVVHIDSSTPGDFVKSLDDFVARLEERGVAVWNGHVGDIRKRSIQERLSEIDLPTTLARRDGDATEKVIVKTNLNSRGIAEWQMSEENRKALGWAPRAPSPLDGQPGYLVMAHAEVPAPWWDDPQIVVERYVDNPYGVFYRAYFVGEQVVLCERRATTSVRRMRDATDRYDLLLDRQMASGDLAEAVMWQPASDAYVSAVVCAELFQLDFGTVDLVIDERGIPYVVDINLTPFWGQPDGPDTMVRHLRRGIL